MRPPAALLPILLAAAAPAAAQRLPYHDVLAAEHGARPRLGYAPLLEGPPPPPPAARPERVLGFYGDRIEWRPQRGADAFNWDVSAELGGPAHRLWLAATGDALADGAVEYFELQALYSRPLAGSGLALQAGLRRDFAPRPRRTYAALGVQGNAADPLWVGAFAFLSHRGELSGRLFAYYDLPLGRRFVLQPAAEAEIAAADVPELGIGAGPVYLEAGLRLRWQLAEPFAPYVGVNWERLLGRTARLAREADEDVAAAQFVLGLRSYF